MVSCTACGCSKTKKTTEKGITFHRFPLSEQKAKEWLKVLSQEGCVLKKYMVLCSRHFTEACFDRTSLRVVRLRPNAVPTIKITRLKYVRSYNPTIEENVTVCQSTPREMLPSDIMALEMDIEKLRKQDIIKSKKIRNLQNVIWRQKKMVESFKVMLSELKRKKLDLEKHASV